MSVNPPPRPEGSVRYLDYRQSAILREVIDHMITHARDRLSTEGADPRCFDHEIGMALARAAVRLDLDLINGTHETIERLEAVVAEMGARLEQAKIAQAVEGEARYHRVDATTPTLAEIEAEAHPHPPGCHCSRCRR